MAASDSLSNEKDDSDWFTTELARAQHTLFAFTNTLMADSENAWDVLQEANLVMCRKVSELSGPDGFMSWAFTIIRYQVMAYLKKNSRDRLTFSLEVINSLADYAADESTDFSDRIAAMNDCVKRLSVLQRKCLSFRYIKAMSVGQIAERMNRRENAVSTALYRARLSLARCIQSKLERSEKT